MLINNLGKYNRTISPSSPFMRYVQLVCGGYQCATDRNMPSESPDARRLRDDSNQSHVPFLLPAVSTCPGQLPTLKWKPVFSNGPTNICQLFIKKCIFKVTYNWINNNWMPGFYILRVYSLPNTNIQGYVYMYIFCIV